MYNMGRIAIRVVVLMVLSLSCCVHANTLDELKQSASKTKSQWQALQQALVDGNAKSIASLRLAYQHAKTEELLIYNRLLTREVERDYQQYLAPRTLKVEHTHQCQRMSSEAECAEKARLEALDIAAKQGSSIVVTSTTDIVNSRDQVNQQVENSTSFKERTSMQAYTYISAYDIVDSYRLTTSESHQRLWFVALSVQVTAKNNDDLYQQLQQQHQHRLKPYLSVNKFDSEMTKNKLTRHFEQVGSYRINMVKVPQGHFYMGSLHGEFNERPVQIQAVNSFYISESEVTTQLYAQCIKALACKSHHQNQRNRLAINHSVAKSIEDLSQLSQPQVNISWYEIQHQFLPWLKSMTGKNYRLPTEVEWEYAARANSKGKYYFGNRVAQICSYANGAKAKVIHEQCDDGYPKQISDIKQFQPNDFGLYDMLGNVAEWTSACWSLYGENQQDCSQAMIRGGSWYDQPFYLRTSSRQAKNKNSRLDTLGFRIAMSASEL